MEGLADVAREKLLLASQISDEPLVTFGLAEIEMELGHFSEAIKEYAKLDNRDVLEMTGISTYQRIGKAYASLGKFEAAVEFLEKAIEIEYDDETVFELATILYDQDEFQKANTYFKQLDTMDPDFQGYEYVYALSLHEENKTEEALRMAQKGISKNAFDARLLLLASQEERYEDVITFAKEPIDNVLTKWNIAKAYQGLEADKKALALYNDLATDLGENPEFLHDYAYILREFGQKEHAHQVAKHYLTLVPDDVNMVEFLHEDEF